MITLGNIMSVRAQSQVAEAQLAQRRYNEHLRHQIFLQNAKRYDAPSSIPKVKRK